MLQIFCWTAWQMYMQLETVSGCRSLKWEDQLAIELKRLVETIKRFTIELKRLVEIIKRFTIKECQHIKKISNAFQNDLKNI